MKNKIVLVPFPFDDLSTSKVRPAVCLTNSIGEYNHVVIAFISSRHLDTPMISDIVLDKDDKNFSETGLHVSLTIRLHRMITVTTNLIRRELGMLPFNQQEKVIERLKDLFGL